MFGYRLIVIYHAMREQGLVRSKRDFSMHWLGRGKTYLRDFEFRDRGYATVPEKTVGRLTERLLAVAKRLPPHGVREEVLGIVREIERESMVSALLKR